MNITLITPTGDRPECFDLCKKWVEAQTVQPFQWIVVDDGAIPLPSKPIPDYAEYIRRVPMKNDPKHTLIVNLQKAFPLVTGDAVIFAEDDEYYAPGYLEAMAKALEKHEVVGIGHSRYYHLFSSRYMLTANEHHASLAQTGIRKSFIEETVKLMSEMNGNVFLDGVIWSYLGGPGKRASLFYDERNPLYVAFKGMPGRAGIGNGHMNINDQIPDPGNKMLRSWITNKDHLNIYLEKTRGREIREATFMGKYRAKSRGYIQGMGLIETGQEFEYTGKPSSWMIPVIEKLTPAKAPEVKPEPDTLYEMTKTFAEKKGIQPPPSGSNIPRVKKVK